jgi:hyperosmotically inducible periplasmic protein
MIGGLLRLILVVVLLVGLGAFFLGYRWADLGLPDVDRPVGTSGIIDADDKARAREAGAEIGETVAVGADKAQRAAGDASVTAKIKAKMALDDGVRAANIDVDTDGSVVTLSGRVSSADERARALRLARETEGVTSVLDRLVVSQ